MQQVRIDGYNDPQTRQTFRQKQGENRTPPARTASRATHRQAPESHPPKTGNAYNEKMKGVCDRRLSAFSGRSNSPKTAEPLPDIEA